MNTFRLNLNIVVDGLNVNLLWISDLRSLCSKRAVWLRMTKNLPGRPHQGDGQGLAERPCPLYTAACGLRQADKAVHRASPTVHWESQHNESSVILNAIFEKVYMFTF